MADLTLENRLLKKSTSGDGEDWRHEISCIREGRDHPAVEQSHLPAKRTPWTNSVSPRRVLHAWYRPIL